MSGQERIMVTLSVDGGYLKLHTCSRQYGRSRTFYIPESKFGGPTQERRFIAADGQDFVRVRIEALAPDEKVTLDFAWLSCFGQDGLCGRSEWAELNCERFIRRLGRAGRRRASRSVCFPCGPRPRRASGLRAGKICARRCRTKPCARSWVGSLPLIFSGKTAGPSASLTTLCRTASALRSARLRAVGFVAGSSCTGRKISPRPITRCILNTKTAGRAGSFPARLLLQNGWIPFLFMLY